MATAATEVLPQAVLSNDLHAAAGARRATTVPVARLIFIQALGWLKPLQKLYRPLAGCLPMGMRFVLNL